MSDSELNIWNYQLYRHNRGTKRCVGCHIYALDALTTNKVEDDVLSSSVEFVCISINTLNTSLLLRCINRAPDSMDSVNDFIINAFIHASAVNFNTKAVT
ncbi:unnamed protein product [Schistosoma mattheei]|uniref:Uncharacterized protein n=1 Tax=Schistosoma mattheei TaxID=31246 RepID=A0A183Q4F8_9TREM|nr:unnamed protein product [Schistosoma mattheei]